MNMNGSNLNMDLMDKMIKKFVSAMGLKINIVDTNYSDYKYFAHQKYGTIREITYQVKVLNKKNELVHMVDVYWAVINGRLKMSDLDSYSTDSPLVYLGFDNQTINEYLAEKTRGMAEQWIETFPERR